MIKDIFYQTFYLISEEFPIDLTEEEYWEWKKYLRELISLVKTILNASNGNLNEEKIVDAARMLVKELYIVMNSGVILTH